MVPPASLRSSWSKWPGYADGSFDCIETPLEWMTQSLTHRPTVASGRRRMRLSSAIWSSMMNHILLLLPWFGFLGGLADLAGVRVDGRLHVAILHVEAAAQVADEDHLP